MKKVKSFFKVFIGRLFWVGLLILVELAFLIFLAFFLDNVLELIFELIGQEVLDPSLHQAYALLINTLLTTVFGLIVAIYIVNSRANNSYKISWLVLIGVAPFMGSVIYLLLGNKNTSKKTMKKIDPIRRAVHHIPTTEKVTMELQNDVNGVRALQMSNYITAESGSGIYSHTTTQYFPLGDDAWPVMLEELEKAEHYIFMEYFIIERGKMWNAIHDILVKKAKEGVDVRVMYDDVGCIATLPSKYNKTLESEGIKCVPYNRMIPLVNVRLNNRDHRKILVIDGHTGFTGGINLADEYINAYVKYGHWKDNAIMLKGRGVHGLTMLFLSIWVTQRGGYDELGEAKYNPDYYLPPDHVFESDGFVQPYGDLPYDDEPVGERVYLNLVHHARKYLYITTPYLIIDEEMRDSLCTAVKEGTEVIILTPHIPDKKMIFNVTRSYYAPLLAAGVKIYEYTPGFIHEKVFISDDLFATVGTINLDYRSLYLHMECGTYLYKCSAIADMKKDFLETLAKSEEITPARYKAIRRGKKLWWAILRIFAPLM